MSAEPLSREERRSLREAWERYEALDLPEQSRDPNTEAARASDARWEASVQAEEAGRKTAEERAERLREFVQRIARDKWTVWQRDAQELLAADDAALGER